VQVQGGSITTAGCGGGGRRRLRQLQQPPLTITTPFTGAAAIQLRPLAGPAVAVTAPFAAVRVPGGSTSNATAATATAPGGTSVAVGGSIGDTTNVTVVRSGPGRKLRQRQGLVDGRFARAVRGRVGLQVPAAASSNGRPWAAVVAPLAIADVPDNARSSPLVLSSAPAADQGTQLQGLRGRAPACEQPCGAVTAPGTPERTPGGFINRPIG
jgi:hypothetical protein